MEQEKKDRLSFLATQSKERELTPEETDERKALQQEYLSEVRANVSAQLENVYLVDEHGNEEKLRKKGE